MANGCRLIDANELWHKTFSCDEVAEVRKFIEQAPTVDAVDVVRCKDCRFIIDRENGTHGCYRNLLEDCKPDDFCSYGERREGE
ncbi:MAG: hypothetical protein IJO04_05125 [Oscillospiraceae bacterium]|nr:hypothetical protein [Oscillospiraceae bacterium]